MKMSSSKAVRRRMPSRSLGSVPSLFIMCLLIVYPLGSLLIQIVFPNVFSPHMNWHFSVSDVKRVLSDSLNIQSLLNSLWIGCVAAVVSVVFGTITAFGASRASTPVRTFINTCVWVIFFAPSFITASGWVVLLQGGGVFPELFNLSPDAFDWFFSPFGLFLVMGLRYFPYAHFATSQSIQNIGPEYIRAARLLGAGRVTIFFKIWIRLLMPALFAGGTIAFAEGFGDFGLASVITPNMNIPLVSFQIYSALYELPVDFSSAAVLSLIVVLVTAAAIIFQFWWLNRRSYGTISGGTWDDASRKKGFPWVVFFSLWIVGLGLILPFGGTVIQSFWKNNFSGFSPSNWTFSNYITALGVGNNGLQALGRTAEYALITAVVVMILGLYIGYVMTFNKTLLSRLLNTLIMGTIAIPGIVIGCGYVFGWNARYLIPVHLAIYGTPVCLGLVYIAVHLPYAIRLQMSAMLQISPSLLKAAQILGARKFVVMRLVILPLVLETVVSTFLIAFTGVMFELPAASMLYPSGQPPISVVINHLFNDSNWSPGSALSIVGMIAVFGSYVLGNFILRRIFHRGDMTGAWSINAAQPSESRRTDLETTLSVTP